MNRSITVMAVTLVALLSVLPTAVRAADMDMPMGEHKTGSLGFHSETAPVGIRWWFAGQKVGVDLGLGYESDPAFGYPDEDVSAWAVDVGVPIVLKSWSRVHVLFRPGLLYTSEQVVVSDFTDPTDPFATEDFKTFRITGEIEAEVFVMENFSVSASHGIGYQSEEFLDESQSSFFTLGNNFTNVGFHVYLFGSGGH